MHVERDRVIPYADDAAVRDCDAVRVSRQIFHDRLRPRKSALGINVPVGAVELRQKRLESAWVIQVAQLPKELKLLVVIKGFQGRKEPAPKQPCRLSSFVFRLSFSRP